MGKRKNRGKPVGTAGRADLELMEPRLLLDAAAFPLPLTAAAPLGSMIYTGTASASIAAAAETDTFTISLDAGQTVSLVATPAAGLKPSLELLAPNGSSLGAATASAAGGYAVLQTLPAATAGTYTIAVRSADATTGTYSVALTLNAAVESETYGGAANDSLAGAQNVDGSFIGLLGGTGVRGAVSGHLTGSGDDWYCFSLADGESASLVLKSATAAAGVTLYDAAGNPVAASIPTSQTDGAIYNFVDATTDGLSGVYYVQVKGVSATDYSLVVTGNTTFDAGIGAGQSDLELPASGQALGMVAWIARDKLTASALGDCVSISGDWAIVGACTDGEKGTYAGAAYIFHLDGTTWTRQAKLVASDGAAWERFGNAVAIDGDTVVVGAQYDSANGNSSGSAYVFHFDGTAWTQQAKLTPSDGASGDYFGSAVAISGDTAVVGASYDRDNGERSGSAYVFHFDGTAWRQQAKLLPSDGSAWRYFGTSVAISGDTVVVGAPYDGNNASHSGSIYVFHFDGTGWTQRAKLIPPDHLEDIAGRFGYSVSISGDTVVVGMYSDDSVAHGPGAAYVFHLEEAEWIPRAKLTPAGGGWGDFGCSVAISGDTLVVGAYSDDEAGSNAGAAYVFRFDGTAWTQRAKVTTATGIAMGQFGVSVAISGDAALVGTDAASAYVVGTWSDDYAVPVAAGDTLTISTATPGDAAGEFRNSLDPAVELRDPAGALVASNDDGAPDGRNALLHYTATVGGIYTVRAVSAEGSLGEYVLSVSGQTAPAPAGDFHVVSTNIIDGSLLNRKPATLQVDFNAPLLLTTLVPADLTVDGVPATGVSVIDGDTVVFALPALADGSHTVALAAGSILALDGTPVDSASLAFGLDTTGPRVIASSLLSGQSVPTGDLVYTATFDEELLPESLGPQNVSLVGGVSKNQYPVQYSYDRTTSTLTIRYTNLPEDTYTLTLFGSGGGVLDLANNCLDGEPRGGTTVPSGNGVPGGDFLVGFATDRGNDSPVRFKSVLPLGSLAYSSFNSGLLYWSADVDDFRVPLEAGQTVTAVVRPLSPTAVLSLQIPGLVAPVTAASPGDSVVLPLTAILADGAYALRVAGNQYCRYELTIYRNAAAEAVDTTAASPMNISSSFLHAGTGADSGRFAVVGTAENGLDAYTLDLTGDVGKSIDVLLTGQPGTNLAGTTLALLAPDGTTVLATAAPAPQGANYDWGRLSFVVPADGVYTITISAATTGTYGLLVTRDLTFDAEPNALTSSPLRPLNGTGGALGALPGYLTDVSNLAVYVHEPNLYVPLIPGTYVKQLSLEQFQAVVAAAGDSPGTWQTYFATQYPGYIPGSDPNTWILMVEDMPNGDWDYEDLRITVTLQGYNASLHLAKGVEIYTYDLVDLKADETLLSPITDGTDLQVGYGTPDADSYQVALPAGQAVTFQTATPGDGPQGWGNTLDPRIEIRGPSGALLAWDDNSAADGRNASLTFTASEAGTYTVSVLPSPLTANPTGGEYVLSVSPLASGGPVIGPPAAPVLNPLPAFTPGTSNTIQWSSVAGATQYRVQYDDDPTFASPNGDSGWIFTTSLTLPGPVSGQTFYYRAQARGVFGSSDWSTAVFSSGDVTPPTAPTTLTATGLTYTQLRLDWSGASDPESGIASYKIYRDGVLLNTVAAGVTTYTDSGLAYSASHSYRVSAVNVLAMEGPKAGPVTGTPLIDTTPPTVPDSFTAHGSGYTAVYLQWNGSDDAQTGVDHYNVYRDGALWATTPAGTAHFTDAGLPYSSSHTYQVSAVNHVGLESAKAGPVTGSPVIDTTGPVTPRNLAAGDLTWSQVRLDWLASWDEESGVDHYNLFRNGVLRAQVPGNQSTFTDSGLIALSDYSYTLSAVNGAGMESAVIGPVFVSTPADPNHPGNPNPPSIASSDWLWEDRVKVGFSEPVEAASAQNVANYAITCGNQYVKVLSASLQSDNVTVVLTTTDMDTARTYSVVVNNVRDRDAVPQTIAANTTAALAYGGFYGQDIGAATVPGSQAYAGATYRITASGAGLAGSADGFYYAYRLLPVDGEVIVRVDSLPSTTGAKAGLMIRSSLSADSPYVGIFLENRYDTGHFMYRTVAGGAATAVDGALYTVPYYLKLAVLSDDTGQYVTAYIKPATGGSWLGVRSVTLPPGTGPFYVGLAATTASTTAGAFVFSNLQTRAYSPLPDAGPAGAGDSYSTQPGATLTVPYTAGVLVNDTDSDGNSLSAAVSTGPAHGTLSLQGNGAFTYTPAPGYSGTDSFVYTLDDGHGLSQAATASITVADTIAPVVTVKPKVTDDATPLLTGTVDDPTATVAVTIGGHTYAALNNGDGTWTLADDVISPALGRGRYDVQVTATDAAGNAGVDATTNELIVYRLMGDSNLDGQVGTEDFGLMKEYFGLRSGVGWGQGDLNSDGQVGPEDFGLLKEHFGEREDLLRAPLAAAGPMGAGVFGETPGAVQDDKVDILDTLATLTPVLDLTVR